MSSIPWEKQELGNELVFYNPQSGDVHVLNATAAFIWKLASKGSNPDALLVALKEEYPEVGEADLSRDLQETLARLRDVGLLQ